MISAVNAESGSLADILQFVSTNEANANLEWPQLRVAVLRNYAFESAIPLLKYACFRQRLRPDISVGDYDAVRQEILDERSHVYRAGLDLIIVSLFLEHLDPDVRASSWDSAEAEAAVSSMLSDLVQRTATPITVNTFLPPLHVENGLAVGRGAHRRVNGVARLNAAIREIAGRHPGQIYVVDSERIARRVGEEKVFDYRFMYMYRTPFRKEFMERFCVEIADFGRLLKGRTRKCLVLDCDNTLWGGVVGEDGLDGIALNPHEYPGRCFYDFQRTILNLIDQGIVVTLCSKNNEADVLEVLDNHRHSLLRRSHVAAWRINWNNKADNIVELAKELNLGLDSFVFVDDSSMECQLVHEAVPDVTVLQVPSKAYLLPGLLVKDGLFDALTVSAEDTQRTKMYIAERERTALKSQVTDLNEYLASLDIRVRIHRAKDRELARVAQLLGKTNQFNLTTQRHPESRVREMAESLDWAVFVLHATDRFSDLGLVGVLIARRQGQEAEVDSLLMSCRALGRKIELVFVDHCLTSLENAWGVSRWHARYIPTKKNAQVKDFWDGLGFAQIVADADGVTYAASPGERAKPGIPFIRIEGTDGD